MNKISSTFDRAMDRVEDVDIDIDWRKRVMVIGGITGAMLGLLSAFFYIRAAEQSNLEGDSPEAPAPSDAVKLGLSLLTIMRTIADWGTQKQ